MDYPENVDYDQIKKIEETKKKILRTILDKKALERLSRLKLVKPDLVNQIELYLIQLYQSGQIKKIIKDNEIKEILKNLTNKKEFKIR